jgi:hypothetical protein
LFTSLSGAGNVIVSANNSGVLGTITIGSGLSLTGGVLTATGGSAGTVTGTGTAGRIAVWNSASDIGATTALTISGNDLQITGQLAAATGSYSSTVTASSFIGSGASLTGLTNTQITTALGFTPYNATNPSGYITSSASITGSAATLTTARTLTVGNTGKTFNGGANVSWSLNEIGAVASSQADTTMWRGTQAQYDAIGTKSSTTLYFIN